MESRLPPHHIRCWYDTLTLWCYTLVYHCIIEDWFQEAERTPGSCPTKQSHQEGRVRGIYLNFNQKSIHCEGQCVTFSNSAELCMWVQRYGRTESVYRTCILSLIDSIYFVVCVHIFVCSVCTLDLMLRNRDQRHHQPKGSDSHLGASKIHGLPEQNQRTRRRFRCSNFSYRNVCTRYVQSYFIVQWKKYTGQRWCAPFRTMRLRDDIWAAANVGKAEGAAGERVAPAE